MASWYLSTPRMTVLAVTDEQDIITDVAPVVRVFIGQPIGNLLRWLARQGELRIARLRDA